MSDFAFILIINLLSFQFIYILKSDLCHHYIDDDTWYTNEICQIFWQNLTAMIKYLFWLFNGQNKGIFERN